MGGVFHSPLGPLTLPTTTPDAPGTLTFRPEPVRIGPGTVTTLIDVLYPGTQTRLRLTIRDAVIKATLPPDQANGLALGDAIIINLPPSSLWGMP